jgi:hypothetical protein
MAWRVWTSSLSAPFTTMGKGYEEKGKKEARREAVRLKRLAQRLNATINQRRDSARRLADAGRN